MFSKVPSLFDSSPRSKEWTIRATSRDEVDLILDINFSGLTPLNDLSPSKHLFDCIAIPGLASHPFGSWQPKDENREFMWIRDELPVDLPGARALIYGYDSQLHDSQSFQRVPDLAMAFINHLETYGWNDVAAKLTAILAHSLGGLVFKEALVRLHKNEERKRLLSTIKGAVLFGVPNLGMKQQHFDAIVGNNPNKILVGDLAWGSDYVTKLQADFERSRIMDSVKCFSAYETLLSPTIRRLPDGKIDRNGPPVILVDRESATCRNSESNFFSTFPIEATHSDMVKFTRRSRFFHMVIAKLCDILPLPTDNQKQVARPSMNTKTGAYDKLNSKYQGMEMANTEDRCLSWGTSQPDGALGITIQHKKTFAHRDCQREITFSPGGKVLAIVGNVEPIRFWDTSTDSWLPSLRGQASVSFSPDGKWIVACGVFRSYLQFWDAITKHKRGIINHYREPKKVAFSPNSTMVASLTDGKLIVRDIIADMDRCNLDIPSVAVDSWISNSRRSILRFSSDSKSVIFAVRDGYRIQNLDRHCSHRIFSLPPGRKLLGVSPDGKYIAYRGEKSTITLVEISTQHEVCRLDTGQRHSTTVAFSPDNRLLAVALRVDILRADDIALWDIGTATKLENVAKAHSNSIRSLTFSPDGTMLASTACDNLSKIWSIGLKYENGD